MLQTRFSGPYEIKEKVSHQDYIVVISDWRRRTQLCHINLLKLYFESGHHQSHVGAESKTVLTLSGADLLGAVAGESDD